MIENLILDGLSLTQLIIQLPEQSCRNPFFENAKFRNLEISRPCR